MTKDEVVEETKKHIERVGQFLFVLGFHLENRIKTHDASKLSDEELPFFVEYTPKLKNCTYGSDEYKDFLNALEPALKHHYAANRHHPEHFLDEADERGGSAVGCMDLIDIAEMICDWRAATERHADGDIFKSIEINQKRFGFGDELKQILINTVKLFPV